MGDKAMAIARKRLEAMEDEQLDDLVNDMMEYEVSLINNGGREEQIAYLLNAGWQEK